MIGKLKTIGAIALFAVIITTANAPASDGTLPRVVSTSVCADQFVLMLAHPTQIAGLSVHATNPDISPLADKAIGFPIVGDSVEQILASDTQIVILDTWGHHRKASFLTRMGFKILRVPDANSLSEIEQATRGFGEAIGRPTKGAEVAKLFATARQNALDQASSGHRPLAVYFLPSGSSPGEGTFVDDLFEHAGFRNYAADLGVTGWQHIDLEALLDRPPEVMILSFRDRFARSARTGFAKHPQYRSLVDKSPTIEIRSADWICAGPFVTNVLDALVSGRTRITKQQSDEPG